ncbi:uncharacterized protein LOC112586642 isoform X1 [Bubalus bubalis]|uniref:uncharacterized protein LOC112586642 isoform X1 n=1 Tax=Bubalus bubalis TaxID=89462 RepID=UPI001E1B7563|nr:uncharacterized protein LOC112586642 isoform X1 [Bubalus bubalis]
MRFITELRATCGKTGQTEGRGGQRPREPACVWVSIQTQAPGQQPQARSAQTTYRSRENSSPPEPRAPDAIRYKSGSGIAELYGSRGTSRMEALPPGPTGSLCVPRKFQETFQLGAGQPLSSPRFYHHPLCPLSSMSPVLPAHPKPGWKTGDHALLQPGSPLLVHTCLLMKHQRDSLPCPQPTSLHHFARSEPLSLLTPLPGTHLLGFLLFFFFFNMEEMSIKLACNPCSGAALISTSSQVVVSSSFVPRALPWPSSPVAPVTVGSGLSETHQQLSTSKPFETGGQGAGHNF